MKPSKNSRRAILLFLLISCFFSFAGYGESSSLRLEDETRQLFQPSWYAQGVTSGDEFGYSVDSAGDVNGDGYDDVVVGSPKYLWGGSRGGAAFVFHGSPAGLSAGPVWSYGFSDRGVRFGSAVSGAGDVNDDGYDDIIVGAYRYKNDLTEEGAVFLFLGSPDGLSPQPDWVFESDIVGAQFGYSVDAAGDVTGDGYDDIIVGARWYTFGETNEGAAYLFYGTSDGLESFPRWLYASEQSNASLGTAVAGVGDVNQDGYPDVLVGAPNYDNGQTDEGAAFLFMGSEFGMSPTPDWSYEGDRTGAWIGAAVAGGGDINHDGYADLLVGAPRYSFGTESDGGGAAFAFYGSGVLPSLTPDWMATSSQSGAEFGGTIGNAGDLNQDGYDDVIVGAHLYDDDQPDEGALFVYMGSSNGLDAQPYWEAFGDKAEAWLGYDVASAGDFNLDGCMDVIAGSPQYRYSEDIIGRAFGYPGVTTFPNLPVIVFLPINIINP